VPEPERPPTPLPGGIRVRRARLDDAAALAQIMGHPRVAPQLLQPPLVNEEAWKARLAETLAPGKSDLLLVAEVQRDGDRWAVVGNAGLHPASAAVRRRHVMGLGISVLPDVQRRGVGRALMHALCDYADRWGQVLRIELAVYTDNAAAIALYRGFGFEVEGCHRGYALRDGEYVDALAMARLHPHPPRIGSPEGA
jgi:putative acetyltransferase